MVVVVVVVVTVVGVVVAIYNSDRSSTCAIGPSAIVLPLSQDSSNNLFEMKLSFWKMLRLLGGGSDGNGSCRL